MSFAASDAVGFVLHSAINGLSVRQQVIADNIANVDTPGFRARSVEFESALSRAIESGSASAEDLGAVVSPTQTPVGANDNNVDLRKESIAAIQTQYQYQIMGRAISDRNARLGTMAGGGA
ncbi:flagellar basal body protein [Nocardioides sp. WV_118_6]|uniref:flagellar basal body rod protein FlgB n=1 Tax=Pimelobacter TaxID=2044 RepID=UPI001C03C284|nr:MULTISPECIES: flagellar basal body protein [Pimelobacter]MBU2694765.1 flagellar biosynthesis protein FlgB [Pimelobacter sp. 30-1]UUW91949.1 flagellar basal body protein [Pimelobacter simplex]UUW95776.1 flagellar basal body protein [Pimelobacter simplex]